MHLLGPNPLALPAADPSLGGESVGVAFAGYVFDMRRDRLTKDGVAVPLAPKPRALLRYFLTNPERVIEKRELITAIWASTVVTDDSLVQLVLELRNALSDASAAGKARGFGPRRRMGIRGDPKQHLVARRAKTQASACSPKSRRTLGERSSSGDGVP